MVLVVQSSYPPGFISLSQVQKKGNRVEYDFRSILNYNVLLEINSITVHNIYLQNDLSNTFEALSRVSQSRQGNEGYGLHYCFNRCLHSLVANDSSCTSKADDVRNHYFC